MISSVSLAGVLLAAPALAASAASDNDRAIRSAPAIAFEQTADEVAAATPAESFAYASSTDLFPAGNPDSLYRDLRATLDADAILGTANLYAVLYTDGNALEPQFTIDDFTLHGPARGDGLIETGVGRSTGLCDSLVELHPAPVVTGSDDAITWLALPALVDARTWTTGERQL
jgi:hypothetical protein